MLIEVCNPEKLLEVYQDRRCATVASIIVDGNKKGEEAFSYVLQWARHDCITSIREFMERLLVFWDQVDRRNHLSQVWFNEITGNRLVMFLEAMWDKIQQHVLWYHQKKEWLRQVMHVEVRRRNLIDVMLTDILSRPTEVKAAIVDLVERVEAIGPKKENGPLRNINILIFERVKLQVRDPRFVKFESTYLSDGMDAADREYCWDTHKEFLSFLAGVDVDTPFLRYLHTEFAMHEICKFMEGVPYNYIVVEQF